MKTFNLLNVSLIIFLLLISTAYGSLNHSILVSKKSTTKNLKSETIDRYQNLFVEANDKNDGNEFTGRDNLIQIDLPEKDTNSLTETDHSDTNCFLETNNPITTRKLNYGVLIEESKSQGLTQVQSQQAQPQAKQGLIPQPDSQPQPTSQETQIDNNKVYQRKSQVIALVLEMFLPVFAAGHFYCGRYIHAVLKVIFIICVLLLDFLLKYKIYDKTTFKKRQTLNYVIYTLYFMVVLFELVDVVMFGLNNYKDGNGKTLIPLTG